jgi:hypothetical protein
MLFQTYPLVVESLDNLVGIPSVCEGHLSDDCGLRGHEPAELQITTNAPHHALDVRRGGSRREVAGHHMIRPASSASYADAASSTSDRGHLFSSIVVPGFGSKPRRHVGGAMAVVARNRRPGRTTAVARCRAIRARNGSCALMWSSAK